MSRFESTLTMPKYTPFNSVEKKRFNRILIKTGNKQKKKTNVGFCDLVTTS